MADAFSENKNPYPLNNDEETPHHDYVPGAAKDYNLYDEEKPKNEENEPGEDESRKNNENTPQEQENLDENQNQENNEKQIASEMTESKNRNKKSKLTSTVSESAKAYGETLKNKIAEGDFKAFLIALFFAIFKDCWDIIDITGISGAFVNIFVSTVLFVILLGQGTWLKRWLIKNTLGKFIIAFIAEFIPGFSIFPTFTIGILLIKLSVGKERRKMEAELESLNLDTKKNKTNN